MPKGSFEGTGPPVAQGERYRANWAQPNSSALKAFQQGQREISL